MASCEILKDWSLYMSYFVDVHYGTKMGNQNYGEECAVGKTQSGYWFYATRYGLNDGDICRFETKEEMLKSLKSEAYLPLNVIEELVSAAEVLE